MHDGPLDRIADFVAIQQVLTRYPHVVDDRDWDAFGLIFTDDVVCDMTALGLGATSDLAALVDLFSSIDHPVAHHLVDPVIDMDGANHATARSKWSVVLADRSGLSGTYDDYLVRTERGWRICRRRVSSLQAGSRRPVPPYEPVGVVGSEDAASIGRSTDVPDLCTLRAAMVGRVLPPGRFVVADYEAWLHADALGSPALPEGVLHPMWVFNAALSGLGIDVQDLFAMGGVAMDQGPLGGEMDLRQHRPMRVGEEVTVRGVIEELTRKQGTSGTFDLMTARIEIVADDGEIIGVVRNGFILPRGS